MPYIPEDDRKELQVRSPKTPGELNYVITTTVLDYVDDHAQNYETINAVIGALECAKLELYRRLAAPYEDAKIKQNGDVY